LPIPDRYELEKKQSPCRIRASRAQENEAEITSVIQTLSVMQRTLSNFPLGNIQHEALMKVTFVSRL
jgi:hypothetical protein